MNSYVRKIVLPNNFTQIRDLPSIKQGVERGYGVFSTVNITYAFLCYMNGINDYHTCFLSCVLVFFLDRN